MAGKKPTKNYSNNKVKDILRPGKATLYISGGKKTFHICPVCNKSTGKGIVYELKDILYCSRGCIDRSGMVL